VGAVGVGGEDQRAAGERAAGMVEGAVAAVGDGGGAGKREGAGGELDGAVADVGGTADEGGVANDETAAGGCTAGLVEEADAAVGDDHVVTDHRERAAREVIDAVAAGGGGRAVVGAEGHALSGVGAAELIEDPGLIPANDLTGGQ